MSGPEDVSAYEAEDVHDECKRAFHEQDAELARLRERVDGTLKANIELAKDVTRYIGEAEEAERERDKAQAIIDAHTTEAAGCPYCELDDVKRELDEARAQIPDGPVVSVARVREVLRRYDNEFVPPYATVLIAQDLGIDLAEGGGDE